MAGVLLTGAGGFVGGAVLRRLLEEGHRVVTWGRSVQAPDARAPHRQIDLLGADDATLRGLAERDGCDQLIHAAWYTNHTDYLVADINRDWLEASTRLFSAYRLAGGSRITGIGTCAEYAPDGGRCVEGETPLRPTTLYGECKKASSERLLAATNTAWARVFFVYGPGDRAGRLVPHLLDQARKGRFVAVRYGGLRRDYIHIDDLAAQIVALAMSGATGAFNTGTGDAVTLSDIAQSAARAAGRPDLAEPNDLTDPAQASVIEADMARFQAVAGPVRHRSLLEGLAPLMGDA